MEKHRKELGKIRNNYSGVVSHVFISCFSVFVFVAENLPSYICLIMFAVHLHSYIVHAFHWAYNF